MASLVGVAGVEESSPSLLSALLLPPLLLPLPLPLPPLLLLLAPPLFPPKSGDR